MNPKALAANVLWGGASLGAWRAHRAALRDPARAQIRLLDEYLRRNRSTAFGRAHGFGEIVPSRRSSSDADARALVDEYRSRVPVRTYDDFQPFVHRLRTGEPGVLTRDRVRRLVPSSGSNSAVKLVPNTASGQRELSRAVDAWLADLYLHRPALLGGPAFWSISPAIDSIDEAGAIPIGFEDDSAYLGRVRRAFARAILAVPDEVRHIRHPDAFRYVTLLFLLGARDLRLMSIWHPSFVMRLLDALPGWTERLRGDLEHGTLRPPGVLDPSLRARLERLLVANPSRAAELRGAARAADLWPRLSLVSCWADGPAARAAAVLQTLVPRSEVQAKGLIATEGIVTIPFGGLRPVAVRSHFFEFLDDRQEPHLVHELTAGVEYTVVLTTGNGLYRYRLGDRVVVDGWIDCAPSLQFIGRDDRVSDRFGEKLSDGFVAAALEAVFHDQRPAFAMLAPEETPAGVAYTLFADCAPDLVPAVAQALERELRRNPHYAWCVDIGQLQPARVRRVDGRADAAYVDACAARGLRIGDVKPVSLHREAGWEAILPLSSDGDDGVQAEKR